MCSKKAVSEEISMKLSCFMLGYIFIVILFHSDFRYFYSIIEDLTAVSTSYFFCVSAFFFYKDLTYGNIAVRLRKRCITLLLPYLLWNLIYMIFYFRIYRFTIYGIVSGLTVSPLCTPSWYLLTLFIFFIPAPLIKCAFNKSYSTVILLIFGILISYLGYIKFQQELAAVPFVGGYLIRMAEYLTPYLIGGVIGTYFSQRLSVNWKHSLVGLFCSCIIVFCFKNIALPAETRYLFWILFIIAAWESIPEKIFGYTKFLHIFTEPAFWINMIHCYFLFVFGIVTSKIEFITGKYLAALKVLLTLVTAYALYYLLALFMPKVLQILTGNRFRKGLSGNR